MARTAGAAVDLVGQADGVIAREAGVAEGLFDTGAEFKPDTLPVGDRLCY
ncbi:MAG: hypothetical protein F6K32_27310 [Desertifilum sp. SIO1I2]|nr:hypothetical protein [Desertifilum sp. SIO1I2]